MVRAAAAYGDSLANDDVIMTATVGVTAESHPGGQRAAGGSSGREAREHHDMGEASDGDSRRGRGRRAKEGEHADAR
jgi:hypothetical protein